MGRNKGRSQVRGAEDGTWMGCRGGVCKPLQALGGYKRKNSGCALSLPDTCTPWPDPNPAGGKCSLSTDLTGEIFPPPPVFAGRKGLGNERQDKQKDLRKKCVLLAAAKCDEPEPKSLAHPQSPLGISR